MKSSIYNLDYNIYYPSDWIIWGMYTLPFLPVLYNIFK